MLQEIAQEYQFRILAMEVMPDRLPVKRQRMADRDILIFNFRAIAGYDLHRFPLLSVLFYY